MTVYVIIGDGYIGSILYSQMYGGYFDKKVKAQTRLKQLAEMYAAVDFRIEKVEVSEYGVTKQRRTRARECAC